MPLGDQQAASFQTSAMDPPRARELGGRVPDFSLKCSQFSLSLSLSLSLWRIFPPRGRIIRAWAYTTSFWPQYLYIMRGKRKTLLNLKSVSLVFTDLLCVCVSCLTLCNLVDCSPLGSSIHGIFQSRILEWAAISFSRGSSQPRDQIHVSCISCFGK